MSLLCFAAAKVMPGFAFPPAGRLGLTSPPSSVLCSAKTASVRPGRFAPRSLPVPTPVALCFVSLTPVGQARPRRRSRSPRRRQGSCSAGTPALPAVLCRRQEALPSSRATPVCTCPVLRSRREPFTSPYRCPVCCLPRNLTRRLSAFYQRLSHCPPLYIFRDSIARPVHSPSLCFAHLLSEIALRVGFRPGGYPLAGRDLPAGGRRTHWVTMTYFKGLRPFPNAPSFARRDNSIVRRSSPSHGTTQNLLKPSIQALVSKLCLGGDGLV